MAEPVTVVNTLKGVIEAFAAAWARGALLLRCIFTICFVVLAALLAGAYWGIGDVQALLAAYGTWVTLAVLVSGVCAAFKTYSERAARPLVLIANEQRSFWGQAKQQSGQVITTLSLHLQATNLSEGSVMPSAIRLLGVPRRWIIQPTLAARDARSGIYSSEHPVPPHSLTYVQAQFVIDRAVGDVGKPLRVVIGIQDHVGRWYRLVFPNLRSTG
jgi:hypothetical protein